MKTKLTRILCTVLSVLTIMTCFSVPAFAATTTNAFSKLSTSNYAKTFPLATSGTIIPYTSSTLKTRGTTTGAQKTAWIGTNDELYIFSVGKNSSGVYYCYCSYPGTYKRVNAYVKLSDVVYGGKVSHVQTTATGKMYMATKSSGSLSSKYWIDKGDPVYLLSGTAVNGKYQVMAPRGDGGYRIGWVKVSDYDKYGGASQALSITEAKPSSSSLTWPCQSTYITTMYRYWNSGNPTNHGVRSNIYNAFDVGGTSGEKVYSVDEGTVVEKGYQSGGFGYYIVIRSKSSGLYALYGHLKSSALYNKGQTVSKGTVIGYMGSTGNSTGVHLHFELYDNNDRNKVIDPFTTYYKGKVSVTISDTCYKANYGYYKTDSHAKAWCDWLKSNCSLKSGDYFYIAK